MGRVSLARAAAFRPNRCFRLLVLFFSAAPLLARAAHAQDAAEIAAEVSFAEGLKLMKVGRFEDAVARFRQSQQMAPASGTLLNIAHCELRLGRMASAWLAYRQAIPLAQDKPQHMRIAKEEAAKLEADLPRLAINMREPEQAVSIELDGELLPPQMWSMAVPVNPGAHTISAILEGGRPWREVVTVGRGERASVILPAAREPTTDERPPPGVAASTPAPAPADDVPLRTLPGESISAPAPFLGSSGNALGAQRTWALVAGSAGATTVVVGIALFASARLQFDSADCPQDVCSPEAYEARSAARSRRWVAYGVAGGGLGLLGTGVLLWLTGSGPRGSSASGSILVGAGDSPWSIAWSGSW